MRMTKNIDSISIKKTTYACTELAFIYDLLNEPNKSIFLSINKIQQKVSKVIVPVQYIKAAINTIKPSQLRGITNKNSKNDRVEKDKHKIYFAVKIVLKPGLTIK